jgi:hypothetical protein
VILGGRASVRAECQCWLGRQPRPPGCQRPDSPNHARLFRTSRIESAPFACVGQERASIAAAKRSPARCRPRHPPPISCARSSNRGDGPGRGSGRERGPRWLVSGEADCQVSPRCSFNSRSTNGRGPAAMSSSPLAMRSRFEIAMTAFLVHEKPHGTVTRGSSRSRTDSAAN